MIYDNRFDGSGFRTGMILFFVLFTVVLVAALVFLAQMLMRGRGGMRPIPPAHQPPWQQQPPSPLQILDERFARGEIDEDEYRKRKATLTESH